VIDLDHVDAEQLPMELAISGWLAVGWWSRV